MGSRRSRIGKGRRCVARIDITWTDSWYPAVELNGFEWNMTRNGPRFEVG